MMDSTQRQEKDMRSIYIGLGVVVSVLIAGALIGQAIGTYFEGVFLAAIGG